MLVNDTDFPTLKLESVLGAAARLLMRERRAIAASILANAKGSFWHSHHDNWNGGQEHWELRLGLPAEVYFDLTDRNATEAEINRAIAIAMEALSDRDFVSVRIVTALEDDPDWRAKVRMHLGGEGITNQGRVRSNNIAAREHDGLLFRSMPEIHFYQALKRTGLPFAPLSVVLQGGAQYQRVEPDFVIFSQGLVVVAEIDGDLFHTETPARAHARLKFLADEGAILERIEASACDTSEKAKEAVARLQDTIEKHRRAR